MGPLSHLQYVLKLAEERQSKVERLRAAHDYLKEELAKAVEANRKAQEALKIVRQRLKEKRDEKQNRKDAMVPLPHS